MDIKHIQYTGAGWRVSLTCHHVLCTKEYTLLVTVHPPDPQVGIRKPFVDSITLADAPCEHASHKLFATPMGVMTEEQLHLVEDLQPLDHTVYDTLSQQLSERVDDLIATAEEYYAYD